MDNQPPFAHMVSYDLTTKEEEIVNRLEEAILEHVKSPTRERGKNLRYEGHEGPAGIVNEYLDPDGTRDTVRATTLLRIAYRRVGRVNKSDRKRSLSNRDRKLTEEQVAEIKRLGIKGYGAAAIRKRMNLPVQRAAVQKILDRRRWKWVEAADG